jgi:hypothetical protein
MSAVIAFTGLDAPRPSRRADADSVRLSGRDVSRLPLCAEHYAAPYDPLAVALGVSPDLTDDQVRQAWRVIRIMRGRPLRLAVRALVAAAVALTALTVIPGTASAPAVVTGCALWLLLTARGDLAPHQDGNPVRRPQ